VQVLIGIGLGALLGFVAPEYGAAMKPLGDGFIKLVRMLIAPIIFTTVVVGMAQTGAMKEIGKIGVRALVYFEVVSGLALVIGFVVAKIVQPGAGLEFDPAAADTSSVAAYTKAADELTTVQFVLNMIPEALIGAFTSGEILQVLLISILFGLALLQLGSSVSVLVDVFTAASKVLFQIVHLVMRLAPIGAFGAMAFTVGRYGVESLLSLGKLMAAVYLTCLLFVFIVLAAVAWFVGFSLLKFLRHIREELLIVLGTSSSESVLPRIMAKLEHLGCSRPVVGLTIPTGYSFNLDGTAIYMTMAALFVAQASSVELTIGQELGILALLTVTSNGAAAVTGAGFITLAATLSAFPSIPLAGLTLLLGVDRFMSEARAITNLIGNAVATMAIAKWNNALDLDRARRILDGHTVVDTTEVREEIAEAVAVRND
jgi:aerobic C4-dicarboxylate transport protein